MPQEDCFRHTWLQKERRSDSQLSQRPTVLMEPMAWKAVIEKSMGRPIRKASAVMAQTAFVGVRVRRFTAAHTLYKGTPPSRENDHSILNKQHACGQGAFLRGVPDLATCFRLGAFPTQHPEQALRRIRSGAPPCQHLTAAGPTTVLTPTVRVKGSRLGYV